MKNILKYSLKWNISVLVIFVLLASSLIWLLTMNFLRQMTAYTQNFYGYHKAYYISKAGLELALVEIKNSGIWFTNYISGGQEIFWQNFDCDNCDLELNIKWKSQYLSNLFWLWEFCNDENSFKLQWGESLIVPLFTQTEIVNNAAVFDDDNIKYSNNIVKHRDSLKFVSNQNFSFQLNLWLILLSWDDLQKNYLFIKTYDAWANVLGTYFDEFDAYYGSDILNNLNYLSYMIISNPNTEKISFCLKMDDINFGWTAITIELATNKFFISSLWTFAGKTIWLQAIYGQPIPNFLTNTYLQ